MAGFEVILPFLRPIEHLICDASVSEIMVNPSQHVFVERAGVIEAVEGVTVAERFLQVAVRNIARTLGDEIGDEKPLLDARLPDGSRVTAVMPPCSVGGTTLCIRKFQSQFFTLGQLVQAGSLAQSLAARLTSAIEQHQNILISGGTGTGKTTLLNALANGIASTERIILIEDTAEIQIDKPNLVRLEARRDQPNLPAVTIRDLLRSTLRLRPDRILLGEVRGGEAFDLLQTLNTGHSGTLATIHANSAVQALNRLSSCVLQAGIEVPYAAIRRSIADAVHIVVHLDRRGGRRVVSEVVEVSGLSPDADRFEVTQL
ncbi:MAG: ATPase, T2SS/T4P/T4SS family [Acidobacteria bacterium]|nr:ATPase, T2SS/T4P/T4SS family [Acidobacteriota bacterium]